MLNGPVVAPFSVYEDFEQYSSGVYVVCFICYFWAFRKRCICLKFPSTGMKSGLKRESAKKSSFSMLFFSNFCYFSTTVESTSVVMQWRLSDGELRMEFLIGSLSTRGTATGERTVSHISIWRDGKTLSREGPLDHESICGMFKTVFTFCKILFCRTLPHNSRNQWGWIRRGNGGWSTKIGNIESDQIIQSEEWASDTLFWNRKMWAYTHYQPVNESMQFDVCQIYQSWVLLISLGEWGKGEN